MAAGSEHHRGAGQDGRQGRIFLELRHDDKGLEDAQQDDEAGGLGCGGKEGGDRRGSALVNIRNPELERRRGDFESERNEDEAEAEKEGRGDGMVEGGKDARDLGEIRVSGHAEDPRDAVNEEPGGEGAEHEVFCPRFEAVPVAAQVGDEDVETDGDQFQRDEDHHEILRGGHPHEAGAGEDRDRVELAEPGAAPFGGEIGLDRRRVFEAMTR